MKENTLVHLELSGFFDESLRAAMLEVCKAASQTVETLYVILHTEMTDLQNLAAVLKAVYLAPELTGFQGETFVFFSNLVNEGKIPSYAWLYEPSAQNLVPDKFTKTIDEIISNLEEKLEDVREEPRPIKQSNRGMVGGTFDSLHRGHKIFLSFGALISRILILAVTKDALVAIKQNSELIEPYSKRVYSAVEFCPLSVKAS